MTTPPGSCAVSEVEPSPVESGRKGLDLLAVPLLGRFLKWRHARTALQTPLLIGALVMVVHGLTGPQLAPRNLATLLTWVHYRGVLVVALLCAGNLFCMACPFMLPRAIARKLFRPSFSWPRALRTKWPSILLFVLVLYAYELFDLWASPWWTAWLIVGYVAAALLVDSVFRHASFCKHVCPIGQFNFVASTVSPLEVTAADPAVCQTCATADCIRGRRDPQDPARVLQRGCELALFLPRKSGNMDCTFCLDCVHACPHDNVAVVTRVPGQELTEDPRRSGVGRYSSRPDLAALVGVFAFGALLNAFGMVSPVYAVQAWLAELLGASHEAPVLGLLFLGLLVVEPLLLVGGASLWTRRAARTDESVVSTATRFAYAFIPLGMGVWLAHYGFHLLTGFLTFIPVTQAALADFGLSPGGRPAWHLTGLPWGSVYPLEVGLICLGLLGSLMTAYRIAERDYASRARSAFLPWASVCLLLWGAALWLLSQPMEMRGTIIGS